jgi:hypothetical protein
LDRTKEGEVKGIAALEALAGSLRCACSVVGVKGAGHDALKLKRKGPALSSDLPKARFKQAVEYLLQSTTVPAVEEEEEEEEDTQPATTSPS